MWLIHFMNGVKQWHAVFVLCALLFTHPMALYAQDSSVASKADSRIAEYLSKAEQALEADRLTNPEGDNAMAYIDQVLAIAPSNPQAITLLKSVVRRYSELVDEAIDKYLSLQRDNSRLLARDVIIAHVNLGERALDQGDIAKAHRHVKLAEELALQYGIDEAELKRFSSRIAQREWWWPSALHKLRIYGTF